MVGEAKRITVVVLTHNRCGELRRTLHKLQALPERPTLIVVDNGSIDGTATLVAKAFPGVQLVRSPRNIGAAARNLGVERVCTPYVAFSDDDTWWAPGALERAVSILERHPDIAVLNAQILVGAQCRPDPACDAMANSPLAAIPGAGPTLTGFMAGAAVMRTEAFRRAGGYSPLFFIGGEEALLAIDILDSSRHIVYSEHVHVHHWPSKMRDTSLRRRLLTRNAIWTAWLRLPCHLAARRSRHVLRALPTFCQRLRACVDALSGLTWLLRTRRVAKPATIALLIRVWCHECGRARHSRRA